MLYIDSNAHIRNINTYKKKKTSPNNQYRYMNLPLMKNSRPNKCTLSIQVSPFCRDHQWKASLAQSEQSGKIKCNQGKNKNPFLRLKMKTHIAIAVYFVGSIADNKPHQRKFRDLCMNRRSCYHSDTGLKTAQSSTSHNINTHCT